MRLTSLMAMSSVLVFSFGAYAGDLGKGGKWQEPADKGSQKQVTPAEPDDQAKEQDQVRQGQEKQAPGQSQDQGQQKQAPGQAQDQAGQQGNPQQGEYDQSYLCYKLYFDEYAYKCVGQSDQNVIYVENSKSVKRNRNCARMRNDYHTWLCGDSAGLY